MIHKSYYLFLLSVYLLTGLSFARGLALDASIGSVTKSDDILSSNLDVSAHLWYKFDQMIFVGGSSGIQMIGDYRHIPALGSVWLRLPFGGRVLPVATADAGYNFGDDPQFVWRGGGGLDIKNGDRSSILVLGGYERFAKLGGHYYLRAGFLLEF
jgi:hypothetical protein